MNAPLETITVPLGDAQLIVPVPMLVRTFLKQYAEDLHQPHQNNPGTRRARIGERGLSGIYAGIARGIDGADDYALEVLDESAGDITWPNALKWAEKIGGSLPTRKETALLFANVPELFERAYYWTCEQFESESSYAWSQSFYHGYQNYRHTYYQLRARAVRRLPLVIQ